MALISRAWPSPVAPSGPILLSVRLQNDARLTVSKTRKNIKVAHPGLLFESVGLGWFEMTYLSVVRVVLISRTLPSPMAPLFSILLPPRLRKHPTLTVKKTQKINVTHPGLLFELGGLGWFGMTYLSSVRVVLISRLLPSLMAPSSPILLPPRLRKDTRLAVSVSKTLEKSISDPPWATL